MPIYEYEHSAKCGKNCQMRFEVLQKMSDAPLETMPRMRPAVLPRRLRRLEPFAMKKPFSRRRTWSVWDSRSSKKRATAATRRHAGKGRK